MITDYQSYPEPSLPTLPSAGGKFIDPVFKTEIMRATDSRDDPVGCGTVYSHWPTFNSNATKLLIRTGIGGAILKEFDPLTFTLGPTRTLPTFPDGSNAGWQSAIWHNTDPNLVFVYPGGYDPAYPNTGRKLYSFDFRANAFTLVKDFGGTGEILAQVYSSEDHQVFVALRKLITDKVIGVTIFSRATNTVREISNPFAGLDEAHVDRSGRWVEIRAEAVQIGEPHSHVLDLNTNGTVVLIKNEQDRPGGHGDNGAGSMVGVDGWNSGIQVRKYSDPHNPVNVFPFPQPWSFHFHLSLNATDQTWATVGSYTDASLSRLTPLANEIFQAALDGSKQVRRICHTRSVTADPDDKDYWATPRANISKDGKFIAFTSNWGNSGRYDLFIAKVETAQPPVARKVAWPKQQGKHRVILDAQWSQGYRLQDDNLDGFAMFEKVK